MLQTDVVSLNYIQLGKYFRRNIHVEKDFMLF
jgi:hypothetical protein